MIIIDIYDKYYDDISINSTPCYEYKNYPLGRSKFFDRVISDRTLDPYLINRIISSKNNYFNIPYAYLINNALYDRIRETIIFKVPFNVNKFEMNILTNENELIKPVYEYLINSITEVEDKISKYYNQNNNYDYHGELNYFYLNRYYTYRVKVIINGFNVDVKVIDSINRGSDWLINKLYTYILTNLNIPKEQWKKFLIEDSNNILIREFLDNTDETFEFTIEDDEYDEIPYELNININTFKETIPSYMNYIKEYMFNNENEFLFNLFKDQYNYNIKIKNHVKYIIEKSLSSDIIYYIMNSKNNQIIGIKNKNIIENKFNHCYISNRFTCKTDDVKLNSSVNFINEYQQSIDSILNIINRKEYVKQQFDIMIRNNNDIININFFSKIEELIKRYLPVPVQNKYRQYCNIIINNYDEYCSIFNSIFMDENIEIKYNTTKEIILSNNFDNSYTIDNDYIIKSKEKFDFVKDYASKASYCIQNIYNDEESAEILKQRKILEDRNYYNNILSDLDLSNDEETKNYLITNYNRYIESLNFILSCNNVYYETLKDNQYYVYTNMEENMKQLQDIPEEYFGPKYKVIPAFYYSNTIDENYLYEFIIDAFSYFYTNPNENNIELIYENYKLTAEKNRNRITLKNLIKSKNNNLTNITRLYKEFNQHFNKIALPKKFSNEYTIIGTGETEVKGNKNYEYIFINEF
jgi:hypothetical protein